MMDCLFVLRDLGETKALVPVIERLQENGSDVQVLALGQTARDFLTTLDGRRFKYTIPDEVRGVKSRLGAHADDFGGASGLHATFADKADSTNLARHLESYVVVTGVVSRSQREFLVAVEALAAQRRELQKTRNKASDFPSMQSNNLPTRIGYYGSLAINRNCALFDVEPGLFQDWKNKTTPFAWPIDELWVPMPSLISPIASKTGISRAVVRAVGQPEVEDFTASLPELFSRSSSVRERLGVESGTSLVFFASGRDEPGKTLFASSFKMFLDGTLSAVSAGKRMEVIVGVHPACSGLQEERLIKKVGLENLVRVMKTVAHPVQNDQFSTNELMVTADKVLSWNSTAASQLALSPLGANKVMFVSAESSPEVLAAVQAGLASQATSSKAVTDFLLGASQEPSACKAPRVLMPLHSVTTMVARIDEAISAARDQQQWSFWPRIESLPLLQNSQ